MITWMQKHKKWLIITIWISTIAFIGAGFVGWGAYSYGNKAKAVAKVGNLEISVGEFQKAYSNLYAQYAKIFQGNFDKEKAKAFELDKQALNQLIQQALFLNLAKEYDLSVSDTELAKKITNLPYFQKNGKFNDKLYKQILSQNNIKIKEFEKDMRKQLTLEKLFKLFPIIISQNEKGIADTLFNIADKLKYKLISTDNLKIDIDQKALHSFWEKNKKNFMTEKSFTFAYIIQPTLKKEFERKKLLTYYNDNKTHFRGKDGKILPFEKAKNEVIKELNKKETKKEALRKYIALKKGEIKANKQATISISHNNFNKEIYNKVAGLTLEKPFSKPIQYNNSFIVIQLTAITPSKPKTFENAKQEVTQMFAQEIKTKKLQKIAQASINSFKGNITDFITIKDANKLTKLSPLQAKDFLLKLFKEKKKKGYIVLDPQNIVLYNIMEQKLLKDTHIESKQIITGIKQNLFNANLLKVLQNKYKTEIYYKGL